MDDNSFHSGSKPQQSLKGGTTGAHTQMPNTSENMGSSDTSGGPSWNSQFRAPTPGKSRSNDKNKAH